MNSESNSKKGGKDKIVIPKDKKVFSKSVDKIFFAKKISFK